MDLFFELPYVAPYWIEIMQMDFFSPLPPGSEVECCINGTLTKLPSSAWVNIDSFVSESHCCPLDYKTDADIYAALNIGILSRLRCPVSSCLLVLPESGEL